MIYGMQMEEDYFCYLYTFLLTSLSQSLDKKTKNKNTSQPQRKECSPSPRLYCIGLSIRNMDVAINKGMKINGCVLRNVTHFTDLWTEKKIYNCLLGCRLKSRSSIYSSEDKILSEGRQYTFTSIGSGFLSVPEINLLKLGTPGNCHLCHT